MVKINVAPALTPLFPRAEGYAGDIFKLIFTCEAFSDGTQKSISVRVKITDSGKLNVCDCEVKGGQVRGMDQDTAETYYLSNLGVALGKPVHGYPAGMTAGGADACFVVFAISRCERPMLDFIFAGLC
jgi:hypothetical protein